MNTVTIELPESLDVSGTYGVKRQLDLNHLTGEKVGQIIDYWFGVLTQRVDSGANMPKRKKSIEALADKLVRFEWQPGAGGGGGHLSTEVRAMRRFISMLYQTKVGMSTSKAKKAAAHESALYNVFLSMMANQRNDPKVPAAEVNAAITERKDWIDEQVALFADQIRKEIADAERTKKAAEDSMADMLSF